MAVLDTGIVAHPELTSAILPGYDFVSDPTMAGDGTGRDSDPTDPGDFCESEGTTSTWHGTKVAGIMAAAADTNGIVGVAPSAKLMNVRVLGRCGGWLSDVADAIRWTAGASVSGVPAHGQGPLIMNLSLATDPNEACPAFMQDAVNTAYSAGALVVAAAGNEGVNKVGAPGNCAKVVTVASHTGSADLASYSNYSNAVTISGPGGGECKKAKAGCVLNPAATLGVTGRKELTGFTGPVYMAGTSAAAPYVAATLGLLRELNPAASASSLVSALRSTARPFPAGSFCAENSQCVFGMLDAGKAAEFLSGTSALGVAATASPTRARAGDTVTLSAVGTSSVQGMTYSYEWSQVSGPTVTLSRTDQATASFVTPGISGTAVFSVRLADAMNNSTATSVSVAFSTNAAPVIAPVKTQKAVVGQPWTLTLSVSDADNNFDRINLLNAPSGVVVSGTTLTWPNPTVGSRSLALIAVDKEGAESAVVEFGLDVSAEGGTGVSDGGGDGGGGNMGMLGGLLLALASVLKLRARRD
ncbi:S8 family serine peptidase [Nostoc sp. CHAB 5834]|nr:S8 family serine peptidase [Nostoc sp. CHAB 5834]